MTDLHKLARMNLYAWVGKDEHGSGIVGLKQMLLPCGMTPIVGIEEDKHKVGSEQIQSVLQAQANVYGKTIHFGRFEFRDELIRITPFGRG